jgi:hypothetical protein
MCNISCTVVDIAEWSDTSPPAINLTNPTAQNNQVSGKTSLGLYTNGDVKITANNSVSAQLSKDNNHKLATEYKLEYDTSGTITAWSSYDSFLGNDSTVKHISCDGTIEVTLSVRVSNGSKTLEDSDEYSATQTLTVCWKS